MRGRANSQAKIWLGKLQIIEKGIRHISYRNAAQCELEHDGFALSVPRLLIPFIASQMAAILIKLGLAPTTDKTLSAIMNPVNQNY